MLLVLAGELVTELRDGRRVTLGPGDTYVVADGDGAQRSSSPGGRSCSSWTDAVS